MMVLLTNIALALSLFTSDSFLRDKYTSNPDSALKDSKILFLLKVLKQTDTHLTFQLKVKNFTKKKIDATNYVWSGIQLSGEIGHHDHKSKNGLGRSIEVEKGDVNRYLNNEHSRISLAPKEEYTVTKTIKFSDFVKLINVKGYFSGYMYVEDDGVKTNKVYFDFNINK